MNKLALNSVIECQEEISEYRQLEKLKGIGPNIRKRIENKITLSGACPDLTIKSDHSLQKRTNDYPDDADRSKTQRRRKSTKEYIPAFRSGPYAMLIALYLEMSNDLSKGFLTKKEIIQTGQQFSNSPLEEGKFSAISGAIKTLKTKDLVEAKSIPVRYSLTDTGLVLAERLWNTGEKKNSLPHSHTQTLQPTTKPQTISLEPSTFNNPQKFQSFSINADEYDICLLIDSREVASREERNFFFDKLEKLGIMCEQRTLELGDFLWVAKGKDGSGACDEVVLDWIVERKRQDDLIASVADGRFKEQKWRLKRCGLRNKIYLVEKSDSADIGAFGQSRYESTLLHTSLLDGLSVKQTNGLKDTVNFLSALHQTLIDFYKAQTIHSTIMKHPPERQQYLKYLQERGHLQSFGCHCQINTKSHNLLITNVFTLQLMRIRQVTGERAVAITEKYPTMRALSQAYWLLDGDVDAQDCLLKCLEFGPIDKSGKRKMIGIALSKRIARIFCDLEYAL